MKMGVDDMKRVTATPTVTPHPVRAGAQFITRLHEEEKRGTEEEGGRPGQLDELQEGPCGLPDRCRQKRSHAKGVETYSGL